MALAVPQGTLQVQEFVWDFSAGDLGTVAAQTLSGPNGASLPLGAVILDVKGVVETACVGATATITLGTTDTATAFLASTAITLIDAQYDVVGQAVVPTLVQVNDTASRDVLMTIGTAELTAGKIRFIFTYYVPSTWTQTE